MREGKDLAALKLQLQEKVQETLSAVADDGIEQNNLHIWSFGDLPICYEQRRGGYEVKAYPALVDEKDSVAIRLFDTESQQQQAMWQGTRRYCYSIFLRRLSTYMRNCRINPNWVSISIRMAT